MTEAEVRSLLAGHTSCKAAADAVGISERTLRNKCSALGLPPPSALLGPSFPLTAAQASQPTFYGPPTTVGSTETTTLVIPDMHVEYHDKVVWAVILRVLAEMKPDNCVIIGDFADCYSISYHPKTPGRRANFQGEVDSVNYELDKLSALDIKRVIYCEGNHEFRLPRYLAGVAPALFGMITIPGLFGIDDRGWEWVPYRKWIKIGKIAYSHEVGESGKYSAARTLDAFGNNIVFGHSHRGGVAYGGTVEGEKHVSLNVGWGGDVTAVDYMHVAKTRDWQHGFGWVEQDAEGNGWCSFIPVINGKCVLRGQIFTGA